MKFENIAFEWKECRSAVARFDDYLLKLRLLGFSVFTLVFTAITGASGLGLAKGNISYEALLLAIAVLVIFVLAIYILDRYYERMLLVAVLRASRLEAHRLGGFRIGLTTEIEFQKKQFRKRLIRSKFAQASVMVNVVYFLIFSTIWIQYWLILKNIELKMTTFYALVSLPGLALVIAFIENSLLKEPNRLIGERSHVVNSPVLFSGEEIQHTVRRLAQEIVRWTARSKIRDLDIVCMLPGARRFLEDLLKETDDLKTGLTFRLHFIHLESNPEQAGRRGQSEIVCGTLASTALRGKAVLVVDDIMDTGATLKNVMESVRQSKPKIMKSVVLVQKRLKPSIRPDFLGLPLALDDQRMASMGIKSCRLFGYGMDYEGHYREIDHIGWVQIK